MTALMVVAAIGAKAQDEHLLDLGKVTFGMHCARCHGPQGLGNGPDAKRLVVAPRDLTSGRFKFKTTAYGTPPTDEDLLKGILGHGIPGAGMPSFANLEEETKQALVAYIKTLSPIFEQEPQPLPPRNQRARVDLAQGKAVYDKLGCALCHGVSGRANGTSAGTLVDAWGRPIETANLAHGWTYGGGDQPIDIYYRIMAGIDGAPMPSYADAVTQDEAWQLSHYVASLQLDANWAGEIRAARAGESLPTTADDSAWEKAPRTDVNLQEYHYRGNERVGMSVNAVSVQALYNDTEAVFRVFWDDPVKNEGAPTDALLLAVKPANYQGDPRGNLHTLYPPGSAALDLSRWEAARPETVQRRVSSLASAIQQNWSGDRAFPASASYDDGRWTLLFRRPLALPGAELKPGTRSQVSFAAWNGANQESGLRYTASQWLWLDLGTERAAH